MASEAVSTNCSQSGVAVDPLRLYANYDFDTDRLYQVCLRNSHDARMTGESGRLKEGLSSILSGIESAEDPVSDEEKADTLRRSRIFYFAR